jgi:hypothetical protein
VISCVAFEVFFGSDTHTYHSQSFVTLVSTYPLNHNSLRNAVAILPNHNNPSFYSSSQIPHTTHIYLPDSLITQTSLKHPSWCAQHSSYAPASSASSPRNVRLPTPIPNPIQQQPNTKTDTGPSFDPSAAPFFGPTALIYPSITDTIPTLSNGVPSTIQTPTFIRSRVSGSPSMSMNATVSRSTTMSTASLSSAEKSSSSEVSRVSSMSTSASALRTSASRTSAAVQSTGAAGANFAGVVGVIAGGLVAGVAML